MSEDFLESMALSSRARVAEAEQALSYAALERRAFASPHPRELTLSREGFDLIAELKLRSPALGQLGAAATEDIGARVLGYGSAGAAAVSVLTEPSRFDGTLAHLEAAATALRPIRVPAMRKDFLVSPYQVLEARVHGASGVLVILRMLPRKDLEALVDTAVRFRLFVLLEAFDEDDVAIAHEIVSARPESHRLLLVGVNCRDLATLEVVPGRLEALARLLPTQVPRVAESGLETADDAARLAAAGYDLALVGGALMKAADPAALVSEMLFAGRRARGSYARLSGLSG